MLLRELGVDGPPVEGREQRAAAVGARAVVQRAECVELVCRSGGAVAVASPPVLGGGCGVRLDGRGWQQCADDVAAALVELAVSRTPRLMSSSGSLLSASRAAIVGTSASSSIVSTSARTSSRLEPQLTWIVWTATPARVGRTAVTDRRARRAASRRASDVPPNGRASGSD